MNKDLQYDLNAVHERLSLLISRYSKEFDEMQLGSLRRVDDVLLEHLRAMKPR